jgi:predicted transposase
MPQLITAKLKLKLNAEQKSLVYQTALAYRDALNYTWQVAFDAGKFSNGAKLQKAVYSELRTNFKSASNLNEIVLAPFIGSGTTAIVALGL